MLAEGTTTRTAEHLHEEAARMGGALETAVTPDETVVVVGALADFAPGMVELVSDVARNPRFGEGELDRIKADRQRLLAMKRTEPRSLAMERFVQAMFPAHSYGRTFPTSEMLAAYTVQDVRAFYDANFGAMRAHLYVVGQFDAAAVEAAVRKAFADWRPGPAKLDLFPKPAAKPGIYIVDRPGAVQSTIQMGVPALSPADPDAIKFAVMNALLGGTTISRIGSNIRERKGYSYSPRSVVNRFRLTAYWAEIADVTTAVTGDSLKEIYAEIDRLQREPPAEQELQAVKGYVTGTFILSNTSRQGIIARLRFMDLNELPADYLETYIRNVMATTPEDVQRLAKSISRRDMIVAIAGDAKQIEKQVRPYGELVVTPAK
jgi:predicted Zn-dependent peptidase